MQRQTSVHRTSGDYRHAPGPGGSGASGGGRRGGGGVQDVPGSPLNDLLNHVNSLLKVRQAGQAFLRGGYLLFSCVFGMLEPCVLPVASPV